MFVALCVTLALACAGVAQAKRPLVRNIRTNREFRALLKHHAKNTGLPVIIDYFSHGCGPCRMIAPHFKRMAKEYRDRAVFAKVDVNVNRETSGAQRISSMPTFQFYLGGRRRHQFSGGDLNGLQTWTRKLAREADRQNVRLTVENLRKFYAKHAPAAGEGEGEGEGGAHGKSDEQLAAMIEKAGGAAGGPGHAKLAKALRKKYGKSPRLEKRLLGGNDGAKGKDGKSSKGGARGGKGAGKAGKGKGGGKAAPEKPNLHLASVDELKEELQNRADAEGFDPDAGEEADDEDEASETAARWAANPDFPERVAVLGAGPAGLAAALYAARAGLRPVVLAPPMGGQLQGKGVTVENYPAVLGDTGPGIVALMAKQAEEAGASFEPRAVTSVDLSASPFTVTVNETSFKTHTVIVATGAETRWLGVEGEQLYRGGGVSSCATCDGFLFRDQDVVVVGGGDTAMEDALVLARTSKSVTVVHRRGRFRASKVLADRVKAHAKIKIRWNATVARFSGERVPLGGGDIGADEAAAGGDGDGKDGGAAGEEDGGDAAAAAADVDGGAQFLDKLTHVHLVDRNGAGGAEPEPFPCGAAFVAIGHDPSTSLFAGQLEMDGNGYLETRGKTTHTSVPGVFAAGDVADHVYRQAVTSAGTGAMAALDAERWLSEMGIKDEEAAMMDDIMAEIMAEGDSRVF